MPAEGSGFPGSPKRHIAKYYEQFNKFQAGGAETAPCFHETNDGSASETPTFW